MGKIQSFFWAVKVEMRIESQETYISPLTPVYTHVQLMQTTQFHIFVLMLKYAFY